MHKRSSTQQHRSASSKVAHPAMSPVKASKVQHTHKHVQQTHTLLHTYTHARTQRKRNVREKLQPREKHLPFGHFVQPAGFHAGWRPKCEQHSGQTGVAESREAYAAHQHHVFLPGCEGVSGARGGTHTQPGCAGDCITLRVVGQLLAISSVCKRCSGRDAWLGAPCHLFGNAKTCRKKSFRFINSTEAMLTNR